MDDPRPWQQAWTEAAAFYRREHPQHHFGTAVDDGLVGAGPTPTSQAIAAIVLDVADGMTGPVDVVDVGAGSGALLRDVSAMLRSSRPDVADRCRFLEVDLRPAAADAAPSTARRIVGDAPACVPHGLRGVLVAHELLDDVPMPIAVNTRVGLRLVRVGDDGVERLGDHHPRDEDVRWAQRWWPAAVSERVELGLTRDDVWSALSDRLEHGVLVAVDYAHTRAQRAGGLFADGTLRGYRDGRPYAPAPDGSGNLTAHVALDAAADAADERLRRRGSASAYRLMAQAAALDLLIGPSSDDTVTEVHARRRLHALGARAAREARAADPLTWLVQSVDRALPATLR